MSAVQFGASEGEMVFATELVAARAYSVGARGRFGLCFLLHFLELTALGTGV
jgi:hypothetical protein